MLRRLYERFGLWGTSLIISVLSVLLSVVLSFLFRYLTSSPYQLDSIYIAAAIPLIIALPVSFFAVRAWIEQIKIREKLEKYATIDQLTGAMNRPHFFDIADAMLAGAEVSETVGVAVIDLDRFKEINDTFGHLVGDEALHLIADTIRKNLRKGDVCGRFGGDEFIVLAPNTTRQEMEIVCRRVLDEVQALSVGADGRWFRLSATIGMTTVLPASASMKEMISRADKALLQAKRQGGGRVFVG